MTTYIDLNELDKGKPHWLAKKSIQASLDIPIELADTKQDGHWITAHGQRVFIKEGQDTGQAIKEHFKLAGCKFSEMADFKDVASWKGFRKKIAEEAIMDYLGDMEGPADTDVKMVALRDKKNVLHGIGTYEVIKDKLHVNFLATGEPGYGRSMMSHFAEIAVKEKKNITLVAASDAIGFYEKLGMNKEKDQRFSFSLADCKDFVKKNKSVAIAASLSEFDDEPTDGVFVVKEEDDEDEDTELSLFD